MLLQVLEGRRAQMHSRGRVLMHKWNGAAGTWPGREMVLLVWGARVSDGATRECRSCLGAQLGHTAGGLEGTHRVGWITTRWELHFLDLLKEIQL